MSEGHIDNARSSNVRKTYDRWVAYLVQRKGHRDWIESNYGAIADGGNERRQQQLNRFEAPFTLSREELLFASDPSPTQNTVPELQHGIA